MGVLSKSSKYVSRYNKKIGKLNVYLYSDNFRLYGIFMKTDLLGSRLSNSWTTLFHLTKKYKTVIEPSKIDHKVFFMIDCIVIYFIIFDF